MQHSLNVLNRREKSDRFTLNSKCDQACARSLHVTHCYYFVMAYELQLHDVFQKFSIRDNQKHRVFLPWLRF